MITSEKERAIQTWFDDMEARPGIYDGLDEIGEGHTISPKQRIHELLLKRLYGQTVSLHFPYMDELGDVESIYDIDFTPRSIKNNTHRKLRFTTSTGVTGQLLFDWSSLVATFIPDGEHMENLEDWYIYQVNHFHIFSISSDSMFKLDIALYVDMVQLKDSDDAEIRDSLNLGTHYIEMGVLHQKDGGYMPTRPLTYKYISEVTGVTASTISDLKNGKKSIDNLTHATFSVLSQFGHVRNVDSMIYAAFTTDERRRGAFDVQKEGKPYEPVSSDVYRSMVVLTDGTVYSVSAGSDYDDALVSYDDVVCQYMNGKCVMLLERVTRHQGDDLTAIARVMIPKDKVSHIYLDTVDTHRVQEK